MKLVSVRSVLLSVGALLTNVLAAEATILNPSFESMTTPLESWTQSVSGPLA